MVHPANRMMAATALARYVMKLLIFNVISSGDAEILHFPV